MGEAFKIFIENLLLTETTIVEKCDLIVNNEITE